MRVRGPASGILVAALLAGCGGDGESSSRGAQAESPAAAAPAPVPATIPEATPSGAAADGAAPAPPPDLAQERRRAVRRAEARLKRRSERAQRRAARRAAIVVAEAAGVTGARLSGRTLRGSAPCGVSAAGIRDRVRMVLDGARVQLTSDCALDPPEGRGRVVLEQDGRGAAVTREVELGAGRWAVEYAALGDMLQIVVEREGEIVAPVIRAAGELTGRRVFREEGRVRLHVAGAGRWLVRIRRVSPSSRG
jgi:hypothetical protein